jgi:phosphonate transport system permease protein
MGPVSTERPAWHPLTRAHRLARWFGYLALVALFVTCWQAISANTEWFFIEDAPYVAADIAARMVPPRWDYLDELWRPLIDTINVATLGTAFAVVLATPIAFLAARNTTPSTRFVRPLALLIIVSSRSINSLIWGLLLVTILGPGVLAGIIAITLRSIGFVAKLLYEAIEEIDVEPVEAVTSTGATAAQVMTFGIWPQVLPAFVGTAVFRWDINIRESTVLGLVGAGGIGLQLQASISIVAWQQVSVILLLILGTVVFSEWISMKARHATI